ncbi:glycosyltransferase family 2 protein [Pedobacter hartonius]|uniref:Glycosyltransferase, GT2 family n=1 Tax=Pedobacter hartonius TaxID=425514 RepID=A0A1H4GBB6_9SPHI|nr:glycosyltransferase family 2 protein [Pedobacter hartonius]SEB06899.1 Glycosyltransferase, GT2 family [Pedobacter hartonius]
MSENNQLAIIIPAYKAEYLRLTLASISKQTDKDFHLYIGDDAGDDSIPGIVDSFSENLKISYRRFEENLGHQSLVLHWNRCFGMAGDETWLWLFSDDDLMSDRCVENFRKALGKNKSSRIFKHDSAKFINAGEVVKENIGTESMDTIQFLKSKLTYATESYVVEYVFHRDLLILTGGFRDLPLAWCADDLFWALASQYSPIIKIRDSKVFWRFSGHNISGRPNSCVTSRKKMYACYLFVKALKAAGIFTLDPQLKRMAVSWYFAQFRHLKAGLNPIERSFCMARVCRMLI